MKNSSVTFVVKWQGIMSLACSAVSGCTVLAVLRHYIRQCCVFGNNNVWHNVCDCSQFDAQCIQVAFVADIYGDDKGLCQYAQQNVIVSLNPPPLNEGGGAPKTSPLPKRTA